MVEALKLIDMVSCTLFVGASVLLFARAGQSRAKRLLAWIMLMWSGLIVIQLTALYTSHTHLAGGQTLSPSGVVIADFALIFTLSYIMELLRPGWVNARRVLLIAAPWLTLIAVYFGGCALLSQKVERLADFDAFIAGLPRFNVWFRLVWFASMAAYNVALFVLIFRYHKDYNRWVSENFSSPGQMDLNWLVHLAGGFVLVLAAHTMITVTGSPAWIFLHQITLQLTYGYLFYKGLFQQNPYPEGFFSAKADEQQVETSARSEAEADCFTARIDEYAAAVREWLEQEKPYLRSDFKLLDVAQAVNLNRTYLSRIFNEGLGRNFTEEVTRLRLLHAERLMDSSPALTMSEVAYMSGFASPSTFSRAFVRRHGCSPRRSRQAILTQRQ